MNQNTPRPESATILVVDDDDEAADVLAKMLQPEHEVIVAYGGEEALELVGPDIDVVLLDRRMPDRNGDEVLKEIRSRGIDCRIVMVTAVEPDIDIIRLDFDDYLVKPVTQQTLQNTVDRMLTRSALDEKLLAAFSLATKMATLESKMAISDLESSEEYAQLEAEFEEYRSIFQGIDPADDLYGKLSTTKMQALFGDR